MLRVPQGDTEDPGFGACFQLGLSFLVGGRVLRTLSPDFRAQRGARDSPCPASPRRGGTQRQTSENTGCNGGIQGCVTDSPHKELLERHPPPPPGPCFKKAPWLVPEISVLDLLLWLMGGWYILYASKWTPLGLCLKCLWLVLPCGVPAHGMGLLAWSLQLLLLRHIRIIFKKQLSPSPATPCPEVTSSPRWKDAFSRHELWGPHHHKDVSRWRQRVQVRL